MAEVFHHARRVEFRDTDAAGMMHFSAFFPRMEEAEHALLRSLGTSVWRSMESSQAAGGVARSTATDVVNAGDEAATVSSGKVSWPRVSARCDFRGPVHFEDMLAVEVRVARLGTSSVTYDFRFLDNGRRVAEGQVTAVCCRFALGEPPRAIPIPQSLRDGLAKYLAPADELSYPPT
jgi:4-hydroxybenzoyl-CoA thioesterase/acyl-CoA thioester hydrolase